MFRVYGPEPTKDARRPTNPSEGTRQTWGAPLREAWKMTRLPAAITNMHAALYDRTSAR